MQWVHPKAYKGSWRNQGAIKFDALLLLYKIDNFYSNLLLITYAVLASFLKYF